ncbi:hypothetical protein Vau01_073720 [Virgisporangium aurantiacum]|uniref:Uncharacterized protein n=1 Tax=Virgisporangium aurantiacum TaxID=175570 RepID=A0A8J3ZDY5_9ACTN|nr:hypothetical protein Vau01_073720 [Virgisporangium aurantiacum]
MPAGTPVLLAFGQPPCACDFGPADADADADAEALADADPEADGPPSIA